MGLNWQYDGKDFTEDLIGNNYGFVYQITNLTNGKKYIGKKFFYSAKTKQVKGKKKKIRVASDWETYWGSNIKLQEDVKLNGEEEYTREVLHLCKNRSECSYWETYEIFNRHALMSESYYNEWVSCRIRKAHLIKPKP